MTTGGTGATAGDFSVLAGQETPQAEPEKTSQQAQQGTSPQTPRTYTQEEYEQAVEAARSKAFSDYMTESGRKYKPVEDENATLKSKLAEVNTQLRDLQTARDKLNARVEDLTADDPDKKRLVRRLQEIDNLERDLNADRDKLKRDREEVNRWNTQRVASTLAKQHDVDETLLINLTDGTPEKMEALAKILPKKAATPPPAATPPATPPPAPPPVDSGVTGGGIGELTVEQIEKMTPEQYANHPSVKKRYGR
jgi:DNA repair exonuclease SbcCD ATPase subunit